MRKREENGCEPHNLIHLSHWPELGHWPQRRSAKITYPGWPCPLIKFVLQGKMRKTDIAGN